MTEQFTLKDVCSDRICDSETGWRDRLQEEKITLNEVQQESFVKLFGNRCQQKTKEALRTYISDPYRFGPMLKTTWFYDRVGWVGDKCRYCAGQDYPSEIANIRKIITR